MNKRERKRERNKRAASMARMYNEGGCLELVGDHHGHCSGKRVSKFLADNGYKLVTVRRYRKVKGGK